MNIKIYNINVQIIKFKNLIKLMFRKEHCQRKKKLKDLITANPTMLQLMQEQ